MPYRRFDYLARDSLHLSIKLGCDFSRILNFSKARMLSSSPHWTRSVVPALTAFTW